MLATIIAEVGEWNRSTTKPVKGEAEVIFKSVRVAEVFVITIWCFFKIMIRMIYNMHPY